jgi:hypothetical protein
MTKKQREQAEAFERIREALDACGPSGTATLLIHDDGGRPSGSGRTHRLTVQVIRNRVSGHSGGYAEPSERLKYCRPVIAEWLTYNVAIACGYTFSKAHDAISMGGYGYSRSNQIATHLSRLAGHALHVQTTGATFAAPNGWVDDSRKAVAS